jgi:hypothetical protein
LKQKIVEEEGRIFCHWHLKSPLDCAFSLSLENSLDETKTTNKIKLEKKKNRTPQNPVNNGEASTVKIRLDGSTHPG